MPGKTILTIRLNDAQQEQIRTATGRSITEFNIDLGVMAELSDEDLEKVAGGVHNVYKITLNHNETLVRDRR